MPLPDRHMRVGPERAAFDETVHLLRPEIDDFVFRIHFGQPVPRRHLPRPQFREAADERDIDQAQRRQTPPQDRSSANVSARIRSILVHRRLNETRHAVDSSFRHPFAPFPYLRPPLDGDVHDAEAPAVLPTR